MRMAIHYRETLSENVYLMVSRMDAHLIVGPRYNYLINIEVHMISFPAFSAA